MVAKLKNQDWPVSVSTPTLTAGELHLWLIPTNQSEAVLDRAYSTLVPDEKVRADRFRVTHARQQYIIAHAALRTLLGAYQQIPEQDLCFRQGERGKPVLDTSHHPAPLHFNLSHSGEYALLGLCRDHPLGVDIERQHEIRDTPGLIKRFFSPEEARQLEGLTGAALLGRFYRLWTCKEALLKAEGVGITGGLDGFVVDLEQTLSGSTRWHKTRDIHDWSNPEWMLTELQLPDGYAGAVACDASVTQLHTAQCTAFIAPYI